MTEEPMVERLECECPPECYMAHYLSCDCRLTTHAHIREEGIRLNGDGRMVWASDGVLLPICERCFAQGFDPWDVPDDEWIAGNHGLAVLCRPCFDLLAAERVVEVAKKMPVSKIAGMVNGDMEAVRWFFDLAQALAALAPDTEGDGPTYPVTATFTGHPPILRQQEEPEP